MFEPQSTDEGRQRRVIVRAIIALGVCALLGYEGASAVPRLLGYGPSARPNIVVRRQAVGQSQPIRFGQGFPGGFGGFGGGDLQILKQFDKDGDGWLNAAERKAAREYINSSGRQRRGFGFGGGRRVTSDPGPHLTPADVKSYPNAPLYEAGTLRTLFIQFEETDWEAELADFYHTDVDVPATVVVDGKTYRDVGVRFRGNSSFRMVPDGAQALADHHLRPRAQRSEAAGVSHAAPLEREPGPDIPQAGALRRHCPRLHARAKSELHARGRQRRELGCVSQRAAVQQGLPARQLQDNEGRALDRAGQPARTRGSRIPRRRCGALQAPLRDQVQRRSQSVGGPHQPVQGPESDANAPGSRRLWHLFWTSTGRSSFLALDNALINNDGYWTRASDYSLYEDTNGTFHIVAARLSTRRSTRSSAVASAAAACAALSADLDPLIGLDDETQAAAISNCSPCRRSAPSTLATCATSDSGGSTGRSSGRLHSRIRSSSPTT